MRPLAEHVHWMFATGFLILALSLFAEGVVSTEVWQKRRWRAYLWPGVLFLMGILMWPVMIMFTNSTLHMVAHSVWAQVLLLAGGAETWARGRQAAEPLLAPLRGARLPRLG